MPIFEDWFEDLLDIAYESNQNAYRLILQAPFMYEDYHSIGLTPQEAYVAEWGE
jgi:hypothetical protein